MTDKNLIYLYDLPKDLVTSSKIAELIKTIAGVDTFETPQIRRDLNKPFYCAIIKFNDDASFKTAVSKLKYFDMESRQCRALPFDKDLLGSNRQKTNMNNVFIKNIGKDLKSKDLEDMFSEVGSVKSAKVSINPDYSSRGYGFVCYVSNDLANSALQHFAGRADLQVLPYNPKDRREMRRLYNNIYVKNFPIEWDEAKLKSVFGAYGDIKSLIRMEKEIPGSNGELAPYAFICFEKEGDREAGPKAAAAAVLDLHEKVIDEKHTLYAREALKKADREVEKKKDQLRFKNSKKRCNLYVKNFPPNTSEDQLKELFGKFGPIENVKLYTKDNEAVYAFVCFQNPDNAAYAKQQLHQTTFNGKQLFINHYEIKELRKIQQEDIRDKADYQNYKKTQSQGAFSLDMINRPEIFTLIQQLIMYMQRNQNQYRQPGFNRAGPRQPRAPGQQQQNRYPMQGMPQQPGMAPAPNMMGQPGLPPQPLQQRPPVQVAPGMTPMGMPGQMAAPANLPPFLQEYLQNGFKILPAVVPNNPNYKAQVGEFIYEYVEKIAGEDKAPKITGMLIDLPIEEIKGYVVNFGKL